MNAFALPISPPPLPPGAIIHVAYSGGLDSTVLLHALAHLEPRLRLRAVHIHHGLQAAADEWAQKCGHFAQSLGIAFELLKVQVDALDPAGPEGAARTARYEALRGLMRPGDCLATAHHRGDQAETVLLRLLRGSGVHGLAAMRPLRAFAPGWLWRPLLELPRERLYTYAQAHGLRWIEDPHNRDPRYARSWLRTELEPLLRQRFPQAEESLARTARLAAEAAGLLDELGAQDLAAAGGDDGALQIEALRRLGPARRHNLLRWWLRQRGFEAPSADALERVEREVLDAAADAEPLLGWAGCELRRYRDRLHAMSPLPPAPAETSLRWIDGPLSLPEGCGRLVLPAPPPHGLSVRFPRGGERFQPEGAPHSRSLKNLFQEAGVPPWVRQRTPLVEAGAELLYVAGIGGSRRWAELFADADRTPRWLDAPPGARAG